MPSETDDKVAQAVIDAANAEAEKNDAEAELDQANADNKTVAAAHAAAALAETEAAKAKQRAQEEIEKDKLWLKETAETFQKNLGSLAEQQKIMESQIAAIPNLLQEAIKSLTPPKSEALPETEVNPDKLKSAEGQKGKETPPKPKPQRRFI